MSAAYTVKGVGISAEARDAGVTAMQGRFTKNDVRNALVQAGVPYSIEGEPWLADRAADRLCQAERRAGRIRAVTNRLWERMP